MAKITQKERDEYQERINLYKAKMEELNGKIKANSLEMLKDKSKEFILRLENANYYLNQITLYCGMNEVSVFLLAVKNTAYLERARQLIYEAVMCIEKIVTNFLDVPFSDYAEQLNRIADISDAVRLNLIKKFGYCIDLVKENFGENTKWKWSFAEIDGRMAVITKNLFDLRRFQKLDDPREEGFQDRRAHVTIIQRLLLEASQSYREKFELSTKDIEDLRKAIDYQKALLRINQLLGDNEKIETAKKQIDVWNTLLEKHANQVEEEKRKKNLKIT
ncbi:MAG: hypothetical protein A2086_04075 [Spirochaetes bacterium GWD1_27_9]|nr:MAG: hypothetical protein A2Z98_09155 [Spirochaetes bacterium GWB1_27_13]OHD24792.1 MAG: hypothetical protein A2Y34_05885 [Spirochaetes bacterium GWC1_27_15]OHD45199.1 MAG: hypothetical protein A2086_04075 [Spirochaetes bacterium GWD1_27_9]